MVTALVTVNSLSVSSSAPVLDVFSSMTPTLRPTTTSAVASTDAPKVNDPFSSFNPNIVAYASAASGGVALLGASALLVYRRHRNKQQLALHTDVVPIKFQSMSLTQLGGNPYLGGQHALPYSPNTGLMYRPTSGMQTTGGPTMSQPMSRTGWTGFPLLPGIGNMSAAAQFNQFPNLHNQSMSNRPASYAVSMNSGATPDTQLTSLFGMTTTEQPRFIGNTITVVPKSTMRF